MPGLCAEMSQKNLPLQKLPACLALTLPDQSSDDRRRFPEFLNRDSRFRLFLLRCMVRCCERPNQQTSSAKSIGREGVHVMFLDSRSIRAMVSCCGERVLGSRPRRHSSCHHIRPALNDFNLPELSAFMELASPDYCTRSAKPSFLKSCKKRCKLLENRCFRVSQGLSSTPIYTRK